MKRLHTFVAVLLAVVMVVPCIAFAAPADQAFLTLGTNGVPISCGTAATRLRENLLATETNPYPFFYDADGEELPADTLAATGFQVRYEEAEKEVTNTFVLLGDLTGTGAFNLGQLVTFATSYKTGEWDALQAAAADINGDGNITLTDLVTLAEYYKAQNPQAPNDPYPTPDEPNPDGGKALVVWFSATGHTGRVAQIIEDELDADTFEVTPVEPYTRADLDYNNHDSRVYREYSDPSLRDVPLEESVIPNLEEYDTIYLGYPIWWGMAAWPIEGVVKANNFDGHTIIPFCTAASSSIGSSALNLEQLAGSGNWQTGTRFYSSASREDVTQWLDSLQQHPASRTRHLTASPFEVGA